MGFGKLVVCPTPIGNLGDVSSRIVDALSSATVVACEDTRVVGKLFELLGIERNASFVPYHDHNAGKQIDKLLRLLEGGTDVVLVSDAGTPTISDPGYRLVREAASRGCDVVALPGPCAAIVALSASGLATDVFTFLGFLPKKVAARRAKLEAAAALGTVVVYESARRVHGLLQDAETYLPADTEVVVAREITKKFETYYRGLLRDVTPETESFKGECVVIFSVPVSLSSSDADAKKLADLLKGEGVAPGAIKRVVKSQYGVAKSQVHDWITD